MGGGGSARRGPRRAEAGGRWAARVCGGYAKPGQAKPKPRLQAKEWARSARQHHECVCARLNGLPRVGLDADVDSRRRLPNKPAYIAQGARPRPAADQQPPSINGRAPGEPAALAVKKKQIQNHEANETAGVHID